MLTPPRLLSLGLAFAAALASSSFAAGPKNRIAAIEAERSAILQHSIPGRAKAASDLGPAAGDRRLSAVTLHFSRSEAQQAALDQLLADQQNPDSPRFRQWLTPAQFGAQFGLSAADVAKVTAWLTAQGLTVEEVSPVNTYVRVSGTVAQLDRAFNANIHNLSYAGQPHISNLADPQLPAAVAAVTSGITGLSDFLPHSHARAVTVRPNFTSSISGAHYLSPADFNTIYDLTPLANSAINGTGTSIAVLGQSDLSLSDVAAFRSAAGLPASQPNVVITGGDPGVPSQGDQEEAQLDVEWAGAIAPRATLYFITSSQGAFASLLYAITQRIAPILSLSYGNCEPSFSGSDIYSFNNYLQQANAQGQTLISASGDEGATDCDNRSLIAADGLAVDFPASSPYATGVGGTAFNDSTGTYWTQATSATGDIISSALSYIPETIWNNSNSTTGLAAGGGGLSTFFSKPAWQTGTGVPSDSARDVPDIALNASNSHVSYLFCAQGSCTNGFRDASKNLNAVGGTSAGVPSFAGLLALIEQKTGQTNGLGNINPTLYGMAASSYSSAFHDITSGNNNSPCSSGSPDCSSSSSIGYSATTGYDLASGLGSVDGFNMANLWATTRPNSATPYPGTGLNVSTTTVALASGQATCGIQGSTVALSVSVSTRATGTVQLFLDGTATGSPVTLSSGAATLPLSTTALSSGAHTITVAYSGDANFAPSRGSLSPSISPSDGSNAKSFLLYVPSTLDIVSTTQPDFSLTPCLPTITVRTGATSTPLTLSATSFNGFTGPVTFTVSSDSQLLAQYVLSSTTATVAASAPGTITLAVTASYTTSDRGPLPALFWSGGAGISLALLACLTLPRHRRNLGLLLALVSVATISLSGCGSGVANIPAGNAGSGGATANTALGSYIVNVSATGTNSLGQRVTHTSYLTLIVTN